MGYICLSPLSLSSHFCTGPTAPCVSENEVHGIISTADILINTEVPQLRGACKERPSMQPFHQSTKDLHIVCVNQLSLNRSEYQILALLVSISISHG